MMPPLEEGHCHWCSRPLTGRRRRWCSDTCSAEFSAQHDWDKARIAAAARDGFNCQVCKAKTAIELDSYWRQHPLAPVRPKPSGFQPLRDSTQQEAFKAAWRAYDASWRVFVKTYIDPLKPEVNHIVPRNGGGYGFGCWNHQSNLELLCRRCHQQKTRQQRIDRLMEQADRIARQEKMDGR